MNQRPTTTASPKKRKKKVESTNWTPEQDEYLSDKLLEEKAAGNMSENSFKKTTFNTVAQGLNQDFPAAKGAQKTVPSVNARWQKVSDVILVLNTISSFFSVEGTIQSCVSSPVQNIWIWMGSCQDDSHCTRRCMGHIL